jgi:tetratricopeptide (TPR) repeat protein
MLPVLPFLLGIAIAEPVEKCANTAATTEFQAGYTAMKSAKTQSAISHYKKCLELDSTCMHCHWELGWGYYAASDWDNTIKSWETVLRMQPDHSAASQWLDTAKAQKRGAYNLSPQGVRVPIGIKSKQDGPVELELIGRFQNYNHNPKHTADVHDPAIYSPKSATFSQDGSKVYINSLEG